MARRSAWPQSPRDDPCKPCDGAKWHRRTANAASRLRLSPETEASDYKGEALAQEPSPPTGAYRLLSFYTSKRRCWVSNSSSISAKSALLDEMVNPMQCPLPFARD